MWFFYSIRLCYHLFALVSLDFEEIANRKKSNAKDCRYYFACSPKAFIFFSVVPFISPCMTISPSHSPHSPQRYPPKSRIENKNDWNRRNERCYCFNYFWNLIGILHIVATSSYYLHYMKSYFIVNKHILPQAVSTHAELPEKALLLFAESW